MKYLPVLATGFTLLTVAPAFSHAFLERAEPPVGSTIPATPSELALTFTEGVEPRFSTIELRSAAGTALATGSLHRAGNNNRQIVVTVPSLQPGTYTVIWHVTSVDTHKTDGNFKFTIKP